MLEVFFLTEKMVKKGYYGNEGLAWDRTKVFRDCLKVFQDHIKVYQDRIKVSRDRIKLYKIAETLTLIPVIPFFNQKRWLKKVLRE